LSLPEVVRSDFDLRKIGDDRWCSKHRPKAGPVVVKSAPADRKKAAREDAIKTISSALDQLSRWPDVDETIEEARAALERLAS
jgi:hypothetical protein